MSYARRESVTITTAADGSATAYLPSAAQVALGVPPLSGKVITLIYTKDDFTNGVDFTITAEASGETLWTESDVNASKTVAPRQATHSTVGVATLYAAGGAAVLDHIVLANDRVKIVLAAGGSATSGTFTVLIGD